MITVYGIQRIETSEQYIGSTKRDIQVRWSEHLWDLRNGKHCNPYLQRAWNKYGEDAFRFHVIEEGYPDVYRNDIEQFCIDMLHSEYNIVTGSSGCKYQSEESRERISRSNRGKTMSEESKRKIGDAHRGKKETPESNERHRLGHIGKKQTDESKQKRSETLKRIGHRPPRVDNTGRVRSKETRDKISKAKKLYWANRKANR